MGLVRALFLPHLVWQVVNGLPTVEFMRNALQLKYRERSFFGFLSEVVLVMNPATLPIWAVGLVAPFVMRPRGTARILAGLTALIALFALFAVPVLPVERFQVAPYFESLEQTGVVECGRCMPHENHRPVYIARGLRSPLAKVWAEEKSFE